jgi:hypothetical protein
MIEIAEFFKVVQIEESEDDTELVFYFAVKNDG